MDIRLEQLTAWAENIMQQTDLDVRPASSDASFRRYFRLGTGNETRIIMDAPPDKEDSHPFIAIAEYLEKMKINAPRVLVRDFDRGFFLLTDLGKTQYLEVLKENNVDELYTAAMRTLLRLQVSGMQYVDRLPQYDEQLLQNEMMLFQDWYLQKHLAIELTGEQQQLLADTRELLAASALQQPRVFVHRDYHSRNLMYTEQKDANPGVLDFQDAVYGPVTYDLVSLLRDCYIAWPTERVEQWARDYLCMLQGVNICSDVTEEQFLQWFDWMGVQRHLKASGIFARLNYRDNKPGYLGDIPRTLSYVMAVCNRYEALQPFGDLLIELDVPDIAVTQNDISTL